MSTSLAVIEEIDQNAMAVFTGENDVLEQVLLQIEQQAMALVPDVSTAAGRDAIRSNAANVAKAKVRIDDAGKRLVAELKELPKKVDASRRQVRERLDNLRDTVRQPLTAWEDDKARIEQEKADAEAREAAAKEAERLFLLDWDQAIIDNMRFDIEKEKAAIAAEAKRIEDARLEKERAEQEGKNRIEREKAIQEKAIADEQYRQQAAIEKANLDKKLAEQRAAQAEKDLVEAVEKAKQDQLKAIELEKQRVAAEALRQKEIEDARSADKEHRRLINSDIKEKLVDAGFSCEDAITIIKLAVNNRLGNLKVIY